MKRVLSWVATIVVIVVVALVIGGAIAVLIDTRVGMRDLATENVTLRQQIFDLGEEPEAPPSEETIAITGERGPQGEPGEDGRDGITVIGPQGPPGETVTGPAGANGADGRNGVDGRDGMTVIGPQGAQGEIGPPGPQGAPGVNGVDGVDGVPVGSFEFLAGGVRYTCTDPNGDGVFECTQQAEG